MNQGKDQEVKESTVMCEPESVEEKSTEIYLLLDKAGQGL